VENLLPSGDWNLQDWKMMDNHKNGGWKMQDWKVTDEVTGVEIGGLENDGLEIGKLENDARAPIWSHTMLNRSVKTKQDS